MKLPQYALPFKKNLFIAAISLVLALVFSPGKNVTAQPSNCTNADFELGPSFPYPLCFLGWNAWTGICCPINTPTSGFINGRHTLMTGPGTDPWSNGDITVVSPNGGVASCRLGNSINGAEAEKMSYTFFVNAANELFVYKYAVLLEDPTHNPGDQPRFEVTVKDQTGTITPCGIYQVFAQPNLPGWSTINGGPNGGPQLHYKTWTFVGIDLSGYSGQNITIEFQTGDCALSGHSGWAYIDAYCQELQLSAQTCANGGLAAVTAPPGFTYLWNTTPAQTTQIALIDPAVNPNPSVTLTSVTGCQVVLSTTITTTVLTAGFELSFDCWNNTVFNDTSTVLNGNIVSYQWDFGDLTTSTDIDPVHQYAGPGQYNVQLIITSNTGCKDTIVQLVNILPPPVAAFINSTACEGDATNFTDMSVFAGGPITNWEWDFGDASPLDFTQNPSHTYAIPGNYTVQLIVTANNGCIDTVSQIITVNEDPVPAFAANDVCFGVPMAFVDGSTVNGSTVTGWTWYFGDGTSSNLQNPSHNYAAQGNYNATLVVTSALGCLDSITQQVVVQGKPTADFSASDLCLNDLSSFTDLSTTIGGIITNWTWSFGDGTTSGLSSPTHTYAGASIYNVQLIVETNAGCLDTIVKAVQVFDNPVADFSMSNACVNDPVNFTDLSIPSAGTFTIHDWNFGDATTSGAVNPTHTYTTPGNYNVTLIVETSNGCRDTVVKPITIHSLPTANFSTADECLNDPVGFGDLSIANSGVITGWVWNFGDGNTSNAVSPNHLYAADGPYNVTLTVTTSFGCVNSITLPVTVHPLPVADFSNTSVCENQVTNFTDLSTITSGSLNQWQWNFGDGGTSVSQNPTHLYASAGTYNVTLTSTSAFGCTNTIIKPIDVHYLPVADFTLSNECVNDPVQFTDISTVTSAIVNQWSWNFGDGNTSNAPSPLHTYITAGTFNVTLTVTSDKGCTDNIVKTITVYELPVADYTATSECEYDATAFTDGSTSPSGVITGWVWDFGDSNGSTQQSPTHQYAGPGTYNATLTVTSQYGSVNSITYPVTVFEQPAADFTYPNVCLNQSTLLTDASSISTGSVNSWAWTFGDGNSSNSQSPSHTYSLPGIYSVTLIVQSNNGCSDTIQKNVQVYNLPAADFTFADDCVNDQIPLTSTSTSVDGNITGWQWNFGDSNSSTQQNPSHPYTAYGTYTITLIVTTQYGCSDTIQKDINIHPLPIPLFSTNIACENDATSFTNTSNIPQGSISSYSWNFGDSNQSSSPSPTHTYASSGYYNATLVATSNQGCIDSVTQQVLVASLPVADFDNSGVCLNDTKNFVDLSSVTIGTINDWNWDFGDASPGSTQQAPAHDYLAAGTYNVTLTVTTNYGCENTIIKPVDVYPLPVVDFAGDTLEGCQPLTVNFKDFSVISNGNVTSWLWDFGDGSYSTDQNPTHLYQEYGTFTVTLTATSDKGCKTVLIKTNYINVWRKPVAMFDIEPNKDLYSINFPTLHFDDQSIGANFWLWTFGDGSVPVTIPNPDHTFPGEGTYVINLVVWTDHGCYDSTAKTIRLVPEYIFFIPNAFSPNGDGKNEIFFGQGESYVEVEMLIFDRWGNKIYEDKGANCYWNGTDDKGTLLMQDVYVYKIMVEDIFGVEHEYVGHVSIIN